MDHVSREQLCLKYRYTAISRKVVGKSISCRKVLWVVLNSLFFKEISNNGKRGHGRMFASAKGKQ